MHLIAMQEIHANTMNFKKIITDNGYYTLGKTRLTVEIHARLLYFEY